MSAKPFFPDPAFGWAFVLTLIGLTAAAAAADARRSRVPRPLIRCILALGVLLNVARSAWLAGQNGGLWQLPTSSPLVGAADGLLFALAGAAAAFGLMAVLWLFGLCGGDDARLLAAVGGWVGWLLFLLLWAAAVAVLLVRELARLLAGGGVRDRLRAVQRADGTDLRVSYSMPIAVAAAVAVLWVFRQELLLAGP